VQADPSPNETGSSSEAERSQAKAKPGDSILLDLRSSGKANVSGTSAAVEIAASPELEEKLLDEQEGRQELAKEGGQQTARLSNPISQAAESMTKQPFEFNDTCNPDQAETAMNVDSTSKGPSDEHPAIVEPASNHKFPEDEDGCSNGSGDPKLQSTRSACDGPKKRPDEVS